MGAHGAHKLIKQARSDKGHQHLLLQRHLILQHHNLGYTAVERGKTFAQRATQLVNAPESVVGHARALATHDKGGLRVYMPPSAVVPLTASLYLFPLLVLPA